MASRSILGGLLFTLVLGACGSTSAAEPAGATCDQFASTPSIAQTRTIDLGADLTVVLCSNASTGYSWGEPTIADAAILNLANRAFQEPNTASLPIVGAAGADVLTLHGAAKGTTTLAIAYGQPWDGGDQDAWTFQLTVTVR
jgi:predicted secreted protein